MSQPIIEEVKQVDTDMEEPLPQEEVKQVQVRNLEKFNALYFTMICLFQNLINYVYW